MFPGGLSGHDINSPYIPPQIPGVRDGANGSDGSANIKAATPSRTIQYGALESAAFYAGFVPEIAKANFINPSNQGHRAALDSRQTLMFDPRNSPSRSQFSEGYTAALQTFAASNTWQLAGPVDSPGTRAKQPNQKFVSPFSSLPIPVKMPWDL
jgi:hypothetical protein